MKPAVDARESEAPATFFWLSDLPAQKMGTRWASNAKGWRTLKPVGDVAGEADVQAKGGPNHRVVKVNGQREGERNNRAQGARGTPRASMASVLGRFPGGFRWRGMRTYQAMVVVVGSCHYNGVIRIVTLSRHLSGAMAAKDFFCHHRGRTSPLQRHGHNQEQEKEARKETKHGAAAAAGQLETPV